MKLPYSKFYWRDHFSETRLRMCSFAAKGLWSDMLAIMGMAERRGFLEANGNPMTDPKELARLTGGDPGEVERLLAELDKAGVFSRAECGSIYSRRMVRDEHLREVRAQAGSKGGNQTVLLKQTPKQTSEQSVGSGLLGSGNGSKEESEGGAAIPTVEEVVTYCDMKGVPPDYAREQHARHSEKHQWVCKTPTGPRLIDWQRRFVRFWASDRATWKQRTASANAKTVPEFVTSQQETL